MLDCRLIQQSLIAGLWFWSSTKYFNVFKEKTRHLDQREQG